jgi:DNA-binding response OmpR family regulator
MSTGSAEKTILIIDDDREIAGTLQSVLQNAGYRVVMANNGVDGQRQIETVHPDLVITDMMMPRMGGFPVLAFLRTLEKPPHVIMSTATEGGRHKVRAMHIGYAANGGFWLANRLRKTRAAP